MPAAVVSFESIVSHFESLPDPRHTRNRRHLLGNVIVIAVCGVIVGCDGPTSIARWVKEKKAWLVDGQEDSQPTIAIDGKTMRRSHDRTVGLGPLHLVSAWASEQGPALGQVATEEKSYEITAIPELIDQIDVKGAVVTIDAMGRQKEIAEKIVAEKGDYVLAVKDNQPKLHQAIQAFFTEHLDDDSQRAPHRRHETREKSHGRSDERYYYLAKRPSDFPLRKAWPSIKAIDPLERPLRGLVARKRGRHRSQPEMSQEPRCTDLPRCSLSRKSPPFFAVRPSCLNRTGFCADGTSP